MVILGIDPGLTQTGYGLINVSSNKPVLVDFGIIKPPNTQFPLSERLRVIHYDVIEIIKKYKPAVLSIEEIFYGKNVRSTIMLSHARAVALLAGSNYDLPIYEYSARKVKQSIAGNGNAKKEQLQFMVKSILKMNDLPKPLDASDALSIALCHFQQSTLLREKW